MQSSYLWFCVCPFHPRHTLAGRSNPAINAVQYLQNLHLKNLYTLYNKLRQNYSFYKKLSPNGIPYNSTLSESKCHNFKPLNVNMFPLRLICISNLKLVHSILSLSHSLARSLFLSQTHIWVIFYWFPFSLHFLLVYIFFYSVFCFRPSLSLSLWLTVIAFSRSYSVSLFWTVRYRHVSFLHCMCLWTQKHISHQRLIMTCCILYGFLICNHDIFVRHDITEGHTEHINDQFEK